MVCNLIGRLRYKASSGFIIFDVMLAHMFNQQDRNLFFNTLRPGFNTCFFELPNPNNVKHLNVLSPGCRHML
ncbi:hypothetical protein CBW18_14790 [Pedobacter sp. AJM]|nr:hypothetical protein CBW18_14790 [Pedobacter sp. AJM]